MEKSQFLCRKSVSCTPRAAWDHKNRELFVNKSGSGCANLISGGGVTRAITVRRRGVTITRRHGDGGRDVPSTGHVTRDCTSAADDPSVSQSVFTITEEAPTRAFSWLKAATTAFTFKTLLRLEIGFSWIDLKMEELLSHSEP